MTDGIDIRIGDVVMYGEHMEPPRFQQVTTDYECRRWAERHPEIAAVLRPVWRRKKANPATLPAPVVSAEQIAEWGDAVAAIRGCPGPPPAEAIERLIEDGDALAAALDEVATLRARLTQMEAARPTAEQIALVEDSPADQLIVQLLDKLRRWSDGDDTDKAVIARFEAKRWELIGRPIAVTGKDTP
jgi:hypothetical protein